MKEEIGKIKQQLEEDFKQVTTLNLLNELKVNYMGRKGIVTELSTKMGTLNEDKKEIGKMLNELRSRFNDNYEIKKIELEHYALMEKLESEKIDLSLPSTKASLGTTHPLTMVIEEIEEIFVSMGYEVVEGPEIESDLYNFEKLNLPKEHPARDMQDSFYITKEILLRTQTSPVQARVMDSNLEKGPIRIICPGKVYRKDDDDMTHSHQFTQIEGLLIDEGISLSHLKGTLEVLISKLFGESLDIRMRPSYFPFTEPSLEVDVTCFKCMGKGCQLCKHTGWIEILGAGMVHPNVLMACGYDPQKYNGFAFGLGPERIAMLKYEVNDIRDFYTNHLEFLDNFDRIEKGYGNEVK